MAQGQHGRAPPARVQGKDGEPVLQSQVLKALPPATAKGWDNETGPREEAQEERCDEEGKEEGEEEHVLPAKDSGGE